MSSDLTKKIEPNLAYLLVRALRWLNAGLKADPELKTAPDLTNTQLMACAILSEGPLSISELARKLGVSRQGAHQIVQVLERLGMAVVDDDPADHRAKLAALTASGAEIDRKAVAAIWRLEGELRNTLGEEAVDRLRSALAADWGPPPGA